jgi:hypothetical protein
MRVTTTRENKMLDRSAVENKAADVPSYRCPTGQVDAEIRVRVRHDSGPVPMLELVTCRRSPADVSAEAFHPTAHSVVIEAQFGEVLIAAIHRATGLSNTISAAA